MSVSAAPQVGDLVVVPARPALGVGRLERLLDDGRTARVFCYDDGAFVVVPYDDVEKAPPGVWDKAQAPRPARRP